MSSFPNSRDGDDDYLDITALVRHVASECLSLSHPFTPLSRVPTTTAAVDDGDANHCCDDADAVIDGTLLGGLHVQGKSSLDVVHETTTMDSSGSDSPSATDDKNSQHIGRRIAPNKLPQLNLLEAMSALELGDKRMDCCEIPFPLVAETESCTASPAPGEKNVSSASNTQKQQTHAFDSSSLITYPPRIAPTCLSDGVPVCAVLPDNNKNNNNSSTGCGASLPANTLLVPTPPCPSLLPHWNNLRLSSTSLLPLLVLQLTALEAYIGTNNGGSNAAETLYCMLWLHDGVLMDMAERLGIHDTNATLHKYENEDKQREKFTNCDNNELKVARWVLFASALGIVRIAEAVRQVVVSADFYEEEDFGVALHGEKAMMVDHNTNNNPGDEGRTKKGGGSIMRFCPALQGSQYCEIIWETALSHLNSYRSSCTVAQVDEMNSSTIDALETIIRLQQSFYQAVHMLSNLSGNTVRAFANLAVTRSRETVNLLEKLRVNDAIKELSKIGLVGLNGQLKTRSDEPELNLLLSASFDPFVNRRYLGNAPVRKACFRSVFDITASLSYLAAELEWGVCDPILHGNSFGRITTMLENNSLRGCGGAVPLQAQEKESSTKGGLETESPVGMNVLSRSLVVLNLYFDDKLFGQYDFAFLVAQHMRQCAVPDQLIVSTDLLSLMVKPMYETLKALCLNRHRERGYTETILLPAFEILQYESAAVDEKFVIDNGLDKKTTPSYATNYVILNTLRLMERYLGLGIELSLYPNWWDLHTAFWYRDFLLSALINVKGVIEEDMVQRMENEGNETHAERLSQQQKKTNPKSKKGKQSKQQTTSVQEASEVNENKKAEDFEERLEYTTLLLRRDLCRGVVQNIAVLSQAKLLTNPPTSITMFTTHQQRFEKRYEAFRTIPHPPPLTYEDYVRGTDFSTVASDDLVASATNCFRSAKGSIDWLLGAIVVEGGDKPATALPEKRHDDDLYIPIRRQEILQLAKVCVHNLLCFHKLTSICGPHPPEKSKSVRLEFNAHKQYCTLGIA